MRLIITALALVIFISCHNYRFTEAPVDHYPDTIYLPDSIHYEVIIIRDTVYMPYTFALDSFMKYAVNPFPGFIIDVDHWIGDSLLGVWMQWGEGGPWHFYTLNDEVKR